MTFAWRWLPRQKLPHQYLQGHGYGPPQHHLPFSLLVPRRMKAAAPRRVVEASPSSPAGGSLAWQPHGSAPRFPGLPPAQMSVAETLLQLKPLRSSLNQPAGRRQAVLKHVVAHQGAGHFLPSCASSPGAPLSGWK